MRAIDWHRFFITQRDQHNKTVFSITELANTSGLHPRSLKAMLKRLIDSSVIQRYTTGRYGLVGAVTADVLVQSLDSGAYITGMYALCHHHLMTQMPEEITCFTQRRHNVSRIRVTPLGHIVFACITGGAYSFPGEGVVASQEQAFCDFVHICRKRGLAPLDIVTFRNLERLSGERIIKHMQRYPATVQHDIAALLNIKP